MDINSQNKSYEGAYVYSIYSKMDEKAGYDVCGGHITGSVVNEMAAFRQLNMNHDRTIDETVTLQLKILQIRWSKRQCQ